MRVPDRFTARIIPPNKNSSNKPPSMRAGTVVKGNIVVENGKSYFQYQGKKIAVELFGKNIAGTREYVVTKSEGSFILRPLASGEDSLLGRLGFNSFAQAKAPLLEKAAKIFLTMGAPLNDKIIEKIISLLDFATEQHLFFELFLSLAYSGHKHMRSSFKKIAELYLKSLSNRDKKKSDNNEQEELGSALPLDVEPLSRLLEQLFQESDNFSDSASFARDSGEVPALFFFMLPVGQSEKDFIPVLFFLGAGKGNSWLFSELFLSKIGLIKIAVNRIGAVVSATLFCESAVKEAVTVNMKKIGNVVVKELIERTDTLLDWPFELLASSHEGGHDFLV